MNAKNILMLKVEKMKKICLKKGMKESKWTKPCIYCKKIGNHHWGLYPKQFDTTKEISNASIKTKEPSMVTIGE